MAVSSSCKDLQAMTLIYISWPIDPHSESPLKLSWTLLFMLFWNSIASGNRFLRSQDTFFVSINVYVVNFMILIPKAIISRWPHGDWGVGMYRRPLGGFRIGQYDVDKRKEAANNTYCHCYHGLTPPLLHYLPSGKQFVSHL